MVLMVRPKTCIGTLWCVTIINFPLIIIYSLNGGILGLIVFIFFIAGLVALTIYYKYTPGSKEVKKILRNQMIAKKYEKDKYVMCPNCKNLVSSEDELCQNCGNQM